MATKSKSTRKAALNKLSGETKAATKRARKAAAEYDVVSAPHVATNVEALHTKTVKSARVIKGTATYRGATIEGAFLIAPDTDPAKWADGTMRASVDVQWFDWRPKRGYPSFAFAKNAHKVVERYNGKVITAVGRKE